MKTNSTAYNKGFARAGVNVSSSRFVFIENFVIFTTSKQKSPALAKPRLVMTTFLSLNAYASNTNVNFKSEVNYTVRGTCTMTFTAYNSAGEAIHSWTETKPADSYNQCLQMGLSRLAELNAG